MISSLSNSRGPCSRDRSIWDGFGKAELRVFINSQVIPWYLQCFDFVTYFSPRSHPIENLKSLIGTGFAGFSSRLVLPPTWGEFKRATGETFTQQTNARINIPTLESIYCDLRSWGPFGPHVKVPRRLCRTSCGRFGWVHKSVRAGDCLYIFEGAPHPFVCRNDGENHHVLLGDAIVGGMTHDQLVPGNEEKFDWIKLR